MNDKIKKTWTLVAGVLCVFVAQATITFTDLTDNYELSASAAQATTQFRANSSLTLKLADAATDGTFEIKSSFYIPDGVTLTVTVPEGVTGVKIRMKGGLRGTGTVAFGAGAYGFSGLLDVQEGVVDLTNAGELAAVTACGPGTLRGATVTRLTLKETLDDGTVVGAPVLDGVTAGSVVVDLGHDETDPLDPESLKVLPVATVASGTSVGRWKLAGTGVPKLKGSFVLEDNKVVLKSASISGMLLIVR